MGFEVVDYGYAEGTLEEPKIVAEAETRNTGIHRLDVHPEEPILYVIDKAEEEPGLLVLDISDPTDPQPPDDDQFVGSDGYLPTLNPTPTEDCYTVAMSPGLLRE